MSAVMLILCLAVLAAYACRVDQLSWRHHPWAMSAHVAGGGAAAWAMLQAGQGAAGPSALLALSAAAMWLIGSYPVFVPGKAQPSGWPSQVNPLDR